MIKVNKQSAPQILLEHQEKWTKDLIDAVAHYGGYDKIRSKTKDSLLSHYRRKSIQKRLAKSSYYKCSFCECKPGESGNIEISNCDENIG
ncbi:hypothetical protein [Anaerotignum propionicum]|uniref:hypothetical protein n=1 Tax=Anaerotignum propionicum TaxID=28446 RepID=UPI002896A6B6|nr:hypothetical protein [Anaerotignum propionicum]